MLIVYKAHNLEIQQSRWKPMSHSGLLSLLLILLMIAVFSQTQALETKEISELGIVEIKLDNGLKVILKPTDFEEEIFFKFTALGGYACLSHEKQISGVLGTQIVIESGIGEMTGDQLSMFLYEHSIEFNPQILPFSRVIEGTVIEDEFEYFFKIANQYFTQPKFNYEDFLTVVNQAKASLNKRPLDFDTTFDEVFFRTNTQNHCAYCSKKLSEYDQVNFEVARKFYEDAFGNPNDFTLVIVGHFDVEATKKLIAKYLNFAKSPANAFEKVYFKKAVFPSGITAVKIPFYSKTDSLTRMTFPIKTVLDEDKLRYVALGCQVMEIRLRNLMKAKMDTTYGLDVAYEFPFFPYLDHPWITIQFRCEPHRVALIKEMILGEIKILQTQPLAEKEFEEAKRQQKHSDEFWLRDNYFWVGVLSNYYTWQWDPKNIVKNLDDSQTLSREDIQVVLKTIFSLENHSIISAEVIPQ